MNRTVIKQKEKVNKEKMLASTGIGNIQRFNKTYIEYQNAWNTQ
jgi:tetraacyldisaccharide-1-P 4'-kinase